MAKRRITEERGEAFGRAFEHFILMELVAIEVKGARRIERRDLRGLEAFISEHGPRRALLVCNEGRPRVVEGIEVLPWREFLARLWAGDVLS